MVTAETTPILNKKTAQPQNKMSHVQNPSIKDGERERERRCDVGTKRKERKANTTLTLSAREREGRKRKRKGVCH